MRSFKEIKAVAPEAGHRRDRASELRPDHRDGGHRRDLDLTVIPFDRIGNRAGLAGVYELLPESTQPTTCRRPQARYDQDARRATGCAVLYNDDAYGIDLEFAAWLTRSPSWRHGAAMVQVRSSRNRFTGEVARIRSAGVDAIYYAGYEVECPYLRADLRDAGLDGLTFMASDGCFLAATIDNADGAAEGMYVSGFAPSPKTAVDEAWVQAYQAVEYRNPDTYSVNGYSAMQVLAEGIKRANALNGQQVNSAIRGLDVQTPLGEVQFQENGDLRAAQIYIFQVKGGQFVQVAP